MFIKEALERQKFSQMKRNAKGSVKAGAIQQYIEQELEVHLSIVEAEKSLEELMEYRCLSCTSYSNVKLRPTVDSIKQLGRVAISKPQRLGMKKGRSPSPADWRR